MELFRTERMPGMIHSNCSGKYAGMLAVCKKMSFDLEGYLDLHHPVRQMTVEQLRDYHKSIVKNIRLNISTVNNIY